jgi:orotidine-5'-phosphate decarboxylase
MYGWQGVRTFARTVEYAHSKGMYVITDGKRNDIGATMEAYAAGHLGLTDVDGQSIAAFDADALTVNGYLGSDGIDPLLKVCAAQDKGIFVLVKTSNKSSGELQNLLLEGGESIYGRMGCMCDQWGKELPGKYGFTGVGAVVGATYPEQLTELRREHPSIFFLVPGYGAQGGGAQGLVGAFNQDGLGAVVNSSRAIMCAYKKEGCDESDFAGAARREALRMKDDINSVL